MECDQLPQENPPSPKTKNHTGNSNELKAYHWIVELWVEIR